MKVMRFASGRGKSMLKISTFLKEIIESNIENVTVQESLALEAQFPWCDYKNQKVSELKESPSIEACNLFQPVITDMGLCHSFNPTPTAKILTSSYFRDSFIEAFEADFEPEQKIKRGSGSGRSNSLDFYVFKKENQFKK